MKAAVVDTGRSARLRAGMKTPRARAASVDCADQVQLYLNRLTALVPSAPKHRRLSRLEVIQYVIDYICDLEDTLLGRQLPRHSEREDTENGDDASERPRTAAHARTAPTAPTEGDSQEDMDRSDQPPPPPPAAGS
ncbi:DNA-binding protein inhibitor ID-4-like [Amphibalanus amphitrite]|uniref:DNA-binding protein inhibitor ID-4-like n=1 Tax=Amphibalanus amphitrite TaxID=1232801 RepID=UPI001C8FF484|nr:DNA-binding protein inhibitor ID-4-like [Amphibalanus amphitrite]